MLDLREWFSPSPVVGLREVRPGNSQHQHPRWGRLVCSRRGRGTPCKEALKEKVGKERGQEQASPGDAHPDPIGPETQPKP